jgi:hypothetical protein
LKLDSLEMRGRLDETDKPLFTLAKFIRLVPLSMVSGKESFFRPYVRKLGDQWM